MPVGPSRGAAQRIDGPTDHRGMSQASNSAAAQLWNLFLAGLGARAGRCGDSGRVRPAGAVRVWLDAAQVSTRDVGLPTRLELADLVIVPLPHEREEMGQWLASRGLVAVIERDHRDRPLARLARACQCSEIVWQPGPAGWQLRVIERRSGVVVADETRGFSERGRAPELACGDRMTDREPSPEIARNVPGALRLSPVSEDKNAKTMIGVGVLSLDHVEGKPHATRPSDADDGFGLDDLDWDLPDDFGAEGFDLDAVRSGTPTGETEVPDYNMATQILTGGPRQLRGDDVETSPSGHPAIPSEAYRDANDDAEDADEPNPSPRELDSADVRDAFDVAVPERLSQDIETTSGELPALLAERERKSVGISISPTDVTPTGEAGVVNLERPLSAHREKAEREEVRPQRVSERRTPIIASPVVAARKPTPPSQRALRTPTERESKAAFVWMGLTGLVFVLAVAAFLMLR